MHNDINNQTAESTPRQCRIPISTMDISSFRQSLGESNLGPLHMDTHGDEEGVSVQERPQLLCEPSLDRSVGRNGQAIRGVVSTKNDSCRGMFPAISLNYLVLRVSGARPCQRAVRYIRTPMHICLSER